jgi:hypothetical protein
MSKTTAVHPAPAHGNAPDAAPPAPPHLGTPRCRTARHSPSRRPPWRALHSTAGAQPARGMGASEEQCQPAGLLRQHTSPEGKLLALPNTLLKWHPSLPKHKASKVLHIISVPLAAGAATENAPTCWSEDAPTCCLAPHPCCQWQSWRPSRPRRPAPRPDPGPCQASTACISMAHRGTARSSVAQHSDSMGPCSARKQGPSAAHVGIP